jgi:hypothetical protein
MALSIRSPVLEEAPASLNDILTCGKVRSELISSFLQTHIFRANWSAEIYKIRRM